MKMFLLSLLFSVTVFAQLIPTTPAQTVAQQISIKATQLSAQVMLGMNQLYNLIWKNPNAANTPCAVWSALGINAVQARQLYLAESQIINSAIPNSLPAEPTPGIGTTISNNSDGSVSCQ